MAKRCKCVRGYEKCCASQRRVSDQSRIRYKKTYQIIDFPNSNKGDYVDVDDGFIDIDDEKHSAVKLRGKGREAFGRAFPASRFVHESTVGELASSIDFGSGEVDPSQWPLLDEPKNLTFVWLSTKREPCPEGFCQYSYHFGDLGNDPRVMALLFKKLGLMK